MHHLCLTLDLYCIIFPVNVGLCILFPRTLPCPSTHHVRVAGGQGGEESARRSVFPHRDVGVGAVEERRVVVQVPQPHRYPGRVEMSRIPPAPATLGMGGREWLGERVVSDVRNGKVHSFNMLHFEHTGAASTALFTAC